MDAPRRPGIVFCDIDGCLTSEASVSIDLTAIDQLVTLFRGPRRRHLPPVVLCTGRPQPYVELLLKILDLQTTAICENGAVYYNLVGNHARLAPCLDRGQVALLRKLREHIEVELLGDRGAAWLQYGKEAQVSVFSEDHGLLLEMEKKINEYVDRNGGPALDINTSHYYLNISLAGIDKGRAIRDILGEHGMTREDALGIGDTDGDMGIRRETGLFACPANARPSIMEVADYISPHPETAGVVDILERFFPP